MNIAILNGPNLNLLGKREPEVYGNKDFDQYFDQLQSLFPEINLTYYQSNVEGELINELQRLGFDVDGIILNGKRSLSNHITWLVTSLTMLPLLRLPQLILKMLGFRVLKESVAKK